MKNIKEDIQPNTNGSHGSNWAESVWKASWTYIRTVVDTVREPFVILDKDLRVIAANETFYRTFRAPVEDTEGKLFYQLGDGQWNIPALRKLLEDILPKDTFFRGFEVNHEFPGIGHKIMLLNARHIHQSKEQEGILPGPIILLAIEDITEITTIAKKLAERTRQYEEKMIGRTEELELRIGELAILNKTVTSFNATIVELISVIERLEGEIFVLKKR
jgi:PAS domain-containing protein